MVLAAKQSEIDVLYSLITNVWLVRLCPQGLAIIVISEAKHAQK